MARILVIDDQNIPRQAVSAILAEAGHEVESAAGGEEGLGLARSVLPDVIVLDVHMPEMDGFEVVERLKREPATAPIPVVFLTAEPPTDDLIVKGLQLGAYDFLSKGCSRPELLARVGVMARIKRGNDELSAIARISDTLIQTLDPAELSDRFLHQVMEVFRADAALLSYRPKVGEVQVMCAVGVDQGDPLVQELADTLVDRLCAIDETILSVEPDELRGGAGVLVRRHSFRSALATRVEHEDNPASLLSVFARARDRFVRGSDGALLKLLGRQANIALDNAYLHAQAQEQRVALENAMTQRSRFFASMSHELRTPINAVIGYNQLLEVGAYGALNDQQQEAVAKIDRSARHQLELVNDILDISKIEAGKLEINREPTDLCAVVMDTVTSVELQAQEKQLELRLELPESAPAETDAARVRQILLNLLSNAVKFTDEGDVVVRIESGEGRYAIQVVDTGPGIAPEDRDRVFEEFEQTTSSGAGGTGLGLAISRRLAHLLGGQLRLDTEMGRGSIFTLELPASPE